MTTIPPDTTLVTHLAADARQLPIPSSTVDCIVTSPPYNCGVDYDGYDDTQAWPDYISMVHGACGEMFRVARESCRVWINVAPTMPLEEGSSDRFALMSLWSNALTDMGWTYRDVVVWKQDAFDGACAWGSWQRPSSPNLRGAWEAIILAYKNTWARPVPDQHAGQVHTFTDAAGKVRRRTFGAYRDTGDDWPELCRNVWEMPPAKRADFPTPFPDELPRRCIRLSTWPGELVLDPFAGSCTTGRVAEELGRRAIMTDITWEDQP